jgi:vacuole morphology and inheritance protein 14
MIVDLQGAGNILTDPQIHCLDRTRFGQGNLGYLGMLMFFNTHQCNKHCKSLGLVNPRLTESLPSPATDFKLIANPEKGKKVFKNGEVHKLCDLCRVPFITHYETYFTQKKKGFSLWCPGCTKKRNDTMKSQKCTECSKEFKSSTFWF